jgi:hypothetical protein
MGTNVRRIVKFDRWPRDDAGLILDGEREPSLAPVSIETPGAGSILKEGSGL